MDEQFTNKQLNQEQIKNLSFTELCTYLNSLDDKETHERIDQN